MNEALMDSTTRHQVYLERLKIGEVNQYAAFLRRISTSLVNRLSGKDITEFKRNRLERLLNAVDKDLKAIYDNYYTELSAHLLDLAEYEAEFEARNLNNAIDPKLNFESVIPAPAQIRAAVTTSPLSVRGPQGGKLLKPFIQDWTASDRKMINGAIRQGAFEGQTNQEILKIIRGTKANNYRDGLLQLSQRHAEAIVRTSIQHVASTARMETWKQNTDVVEKYQWVSTLDGRTSQMCRSLDQQTFELGKGPMPPIHIRCRSTHVAELKEEFAFLSEGRTRSSMSGYVDGNQSYYAWLKKQPAIFQDDALGPTRATLFREGGLSVERFGKLNLSDNFEPLSLDQMKKKEPNAFKNAGIV